MALTKGEAVKIAGGIVVKVGEALEDENTPDVITKDEMFNIIKEAAQELFTEYSD